MKNKIIAILNEIRPEFEFTDEKNFVEEGMLDSFDIVSLVSELDEKFGISISGLEIIPENFSSLGKIEALLSRYGVKD
jgi:acyl carrier protein